MSDTPSIDAITSPPLGAGYIRRFAAERVEKMLRLALAEATAERDEARKQRDGFKRWKIDHERILDVSNQMFRACRATIAHLLDDPETGQEGICRNMLRLAEERDELRAEVERLKAERDNWRVSSVCRELNAELERLKAELAAMKGPQQ